MAEDTNYSDKNRVEIAGNCAADPRFQYTQSGKAVADVVIFSNRTWTNKDGTQGKSSVKVKLVAWGELAEDMHKGVFKGDKIVGEGQLQAPEAYVDKAGEAQAINVVQIFSGDVMFKKGGTSAPAPQDEAEDSNENMIADQHLLDMGDIPF